MVNKFKPIISPARLKKKSKALLKSGERPDAIAVGVAVGMFFGITPLFGLKTLLAIGVTWLFRGSKIAAAIAVTFHDVLLPVAPFLLRAEYDLGYWTTSSPHEFPPHLHIHAIQHSDWLHWSTFLLAGRPILIGSVIIGLPLALITYVVVLLVLKKKMSVRS